MVEGSNAIAARLSEALDALTMTVLRETLEFLEKETDGFGKPGTIALSPKATFALSRPKYKEEFTRMVLERLRVRYAKGKKKGRKLDLQLLERERPRLRPFPGTVTHLRYEIGPEGPEDLRKPVPALPRGGEEGREGDVPF